MARQAIETITGHGIARRGEWSCNGTVNISLSEDGTQPVKCKVVFDIESLVQGESSGKTEITGTTETGVSFWIPDFHVESSNQHLAGSNGRLEDGLIWYGVAEMYIQGHLANIDTDDGRVKCTIYISPTPLARADTVYSQNDDGTIAIYDYPLYKFPLKGEVSWVTSLGTAKLHYGYQYLSDQIGMDRAIIQLRRTSIDLTPELPSPVNLGEHLVNLPTIFDETLWLISFLSRRRVAWYEAVASYIPNGQEHESLQATVRRRQWFGFREEVDERLWPLPLVNLNSLQSGLFQELLSKYLASPYQNIIRQTIIMLLVSFDEGYVENRYTSVYTAFEGFVFGLDTDNSVSELLGPSQFEKLRKKIKKLLLEQLNEHVNVDAVIQKLPELRRRSFLSQLKLQLDRWAFDVSDLWPTTVDINNELQALIRRRNVYIHQGQMNDYSLYLQDMERLQVLLELWILKLLDCPESAIDQVAYSPLQHKQPSPNN